MNQTPLPLKKNRSYNPAVRWPRKHPLRMYRWLQFILSHLPRKRQPIAQSKKPVNTSLFLHAVYLSPHKSQPTNQDLQKMLELLTRCLVPHPFSRKTSLIQQLQYMGKRREIMPGLSHKGRYLVCITRAASLTT